MKIAKVAEIFVLCLMVASGCQKASTVPSGTVTGVVTYEGKPVPEGVVWFVPVGDGTSVQGQIGSQGEYQIGSGAAVLRAGEYQVAVTPPSIRTPDTETSMGMEVVKEMKEIPVKYHTPAKSGLTFTVKEGRQTFDIKMTK